jgi:hypothetical protein
MWTDATELTVVFEMFVKAPNNVNNCDRISITVVPTGNKLICVVPAKIPCVAGMLCSVYQEAVV